MSGGETNTDIVSDQLILQPLPTYSTVVTQYQAKDALCYTSDFKSFKSCYLK